MQKEKTHTGRTNKDCSERRQAAKEKKEKKKTNRVSRNHHEPSNGLWR